MNRFELNYHFVHAQLQGQNERTKSVQSRATNFMTLSIALLGVTGLILTGEFEPEFGESTWILFWGSSVVVGAFFVLTIFFSMTASYVGKWYLTPHPTEMQHHIANPENTDEQIWAWTIQSMLEAFRLNEATVTRQARALSKAMFFFWGEAVFLIALAVSAII